jgi:hypothetical protein
VTRRAVSEGGALLLVGALALVVALVPLLYNRRFYYIDDTQTYSVGLWDYTGRMLRDGGLTWVQPEFWLAGNAALDAQHGNLSPIAWAISLIVAYSSHVGLAATGIKIFWLVAASIAVYLLARTYVDRPWAILAGVLAPLNGVTTYIDAPSWTVLLITFALVAFFWWSLRKMAAITPLPAIGIAVLAVGLGFVQTVILIGIVLLATFVEHLLRKDRVAVWLTALVGAVAVAYAVVVFLPGALTSSVTFRDSAGFANDEIMGGSLGTLAISQFPTANPEMSWSWGTIAPVPFAYVSWALVLAFFVPWRRLAPVPARIWILLGMGAVLVLLYVGPPLVGPTRMPFRYYPLLALVMLLLLAIGCAAAQRDGWRVTAPRVAGAGAVIGWGAYATFSNAPESVPQVLAGLVVNIVATVSVIAIVRRRPYQSRSRWLVSAVLIGTVLVTGVQHYFFPAAPVYDFALPSEKADFQAVQPEAVAPSVVVGTLRFGDGVETAYAQELLLGNAWLMNDAGVQNLYSSLGRRGYSDRFCIDFLGQTCPEFLTDLFSEQPSTGQLLVDQLGINTLILTRDTAERRPELLAQTSVGSSSLPGWHMADRGRYTETWVRDTSAECVEGGMTWASAGVDARVTSSTGESLVLEVEAVPAEGGTVAFCRMQWPGHAASAGSVIAIDDYLLGVRLTPEDLGEVVISYDVPGEWAVLGASGALVAFAVGAVALWGVDRHRRRESRSIRS